MNKTNSQTSFAEMMSKKKNVIIILIILAITVGHFGIQLSFIESENQRIIELSAKIAPVIEQNIQAKPQVDEQLETKETDVVLSPKPLASQKDIQTVKVLQRELNRQSESAPIQNPLKKAKRESKSERLRRAEKILTGF